MSKKKVRELSEPEVREIVKLIGNSSFKFMLRRISTKILSNKEYADISINEFTSIILIAMASVDASLLRWIETCYKAKLGEEIDFEKLRFTLIRNLNEQLGVEVH